MNFNWQIHRAVRYLKKNGVIAYPTEAVYGLGCDPLNAQAVHQILALKKRPVTKGLILIAAEWKQLAPLVEIPNETILKKMLTTWPGPTTWVVQARPWIPSWLKGNRDSLAVRVTNHPIASKLCYAFEGPIVSTSANITGYKSAKNPLTVRRQFGESEILIVPGAIGEEKQTTKIIDAISDRIIR